MRCEDCSHFRSDIFRCLIYSRLIPLQLLFTMVFHYDIKTAFSTPFSFYREYQNLVSSPFFSFLSSTFVHGIIYHIFLLLFYAQYKVTFFKSLCIYNPSTPVTSSVSGNLSIFPFLSCFFLFWSQCFFPFEVNSLLKKVFYLIIFLSSIIFSVPLSTQGSCSGSNM